MNFKEYQELARSTAIYPNEYCIIYPALGLGGEAGEVLELVKKEIRDGIIGDAVSQEWSDKVKKELGDVLWYVANLSYDLNISLEDIAETNIAKLKSRKERDVLHGSGDER